MIGIAGRKPQYAYVGGELVMVKKPLRMRSSLAVLLPAEWVKVNELGKPIKYFLLEVKDTKIVISPHYDEVEMGVI